MSCFFATGRHPLNVRICTLKVEARVRTPLGLRENEPVRGHFLTFWRVSLSPNEPGLPTEFQKRRPRKGKRSGTTGPDG